MKNILTRYILPLVLVLSVVMIYGNMLADGRHGFLFIDHTVTARYYWYQIGMILSFICLSGVIFVVSKGNLRWSSLLLCAYWLVEFVEFIGWYNTTPKHVHWIVFSVLLVFGFWYNDKRRIRERGNCAQD